MFLIPGGTDIFGKCLEKYQEKKEERRASVDQSCGTDEENSNDGNEKSKKFATQIGDLSALDDADLRNGEEEEEPKLKMAGFSDFGGENIQSETLHKVTYQFKAEKILEYSLDSMSSPSALPSVKIQIMGRKVGLSCKGKTLLAVVNKLFKFKCSRLLEGDGWDPGWDRGWDPSYLLKSSRFMYYFIVKPTYCQNSN